MDDPIATLDQMRRDPRWDQFSREEQQHIVDTVMQGRSSQPDRQTGAAGPEQPMGPQPDPYQQMLQQQRTGEAGHGGLEPSATETAATTIPLVTSGGAGMLGNAVGGPVVAGLAATAGYPVGKHINQALGLEPQGKTSLWEDLKSSIVPAAAPITAAGVGAMIPPIFPGSKVLLPAAAAALAEKGNQLFGVTQPSDERVIGAGLAAGVPIAVAEGGNSLLNWLARFNPATPTVLAEQNLKTALKAPERFAPTSPSAPQYAAIDKDPEVRRMVQSVTQQQVPSPILGNASNPANAVPLTTTQNVTTTRGTIPMTAALAKQAENEAYLARLQEHADPTMVNEMRKYPLSPNMTLEQVMTQRRNMNSYRGEARQGMTPDAWSYYGKVMDAMRGDVAAGSPLGAAANAADEAFKQEQIVNTLLKPVIANDKSPMGLPGIQNIGGVLSAWRKMRQTDPQIAALPDAEWEAMVAPVVKAAQQKGILGAGATQWMLERAPVAIGGTVGYAMGGPAGAAAGGVLGALGKTALSAHAMERGLTSQSYRDSLWRRLNDTPLSAEARARASAFGETIAQHFLNQEQQ